MVNFSSILDMEKHLIYIFVCNFKKMHQLTNKAY